RQLRSAWAAANACAIRCPSAVSGTSRRPQKRSCRLSSVWPCLSKNKLITRPLLGPSPSEMVIQSPCRAVTPRLLRARVTDRERWPLRPCSAVPSVLQARSARAVDPLARPLPEGVGADLVEAIEARQP